MSRKRSRSFRRLVAAALAVSLLSAACGDAEESDSGGGSSNQNAEGSQQLLADEGTPRRGGTLHFGIGAATENFCLRVAQLAAEGMQVAAAVYEPLVSYDDEQNLVGVLAEEFTPNEDATEWTLKIRQGITFQNGEPLDAAAVKMNLNAYRGGDAATAEGLPPVTSIALFPLVFEPIADVTAPDAQTVVVKMKKPWAAFPAHLASGRIGMMAPEQLKLPEQSGDSTCSNTLIGTGPFMPKSNPIDLRSATIDLVANDKYWREGADGKKLPYLDALTFEVVEASSTRVERLTAKNNYFDMTSSNSPPDIVGIEELSEAGEIQSYVEPDDYAEVSYVMLNNSKPPFDDRRAREAMIRAVNLENLNELANKGRNTLTNTPFGPKTLGYTDDVEWPEYDPARAAELVQELGGKLEFKLMYAASPYTEQLVELIKEEAEQVPGVKVTVEPVLQAKLISTALDATKWDANVWRNHPGADPDTQYVWWHSTMLTNFGKINNPNIDKALDEGRAETDPAKRQTIYEEIGKEFGKEMHNAWSWYSLWGYGMRNNVRGLTPTNPDGSKALGYWAGFTPVGEIWLTEE